MSITKKIVILLLLFLRPIYGGSYFESSHMTIVRRKMRDITASFNDPSGCFLQKKRRRNRLIDDIGNHFNKLTTRINKWNYYGSCFDEYRMRNIKRENLFSVL